MENLGVLHRFGGLRFDAVLFATAGLPARACSSNSLLNLATKLCTGQAQASPKAQMVRPAMLSATLVSRPTSLGLAVAGRRGGGDFLHPERAFAAGRALAARFVRVERGDVGEALDHVARLVHDDDAAAARHGTCCGEGVEIERDVLQAQFLFLHRAVGLLRLDLVAVAGLA